MARESKRNKDAAARRSWKIKNKCHQGSSSRDQGSDINKIISNKNNEAEVEVHFLFFSYI